MATALAGAPLQVRSWCDNVDVDFGGGRGGRRYGRGGLCLSLRLVASPKEGKLSEGKKACAKSEVELFALGRTACRRECAIGGDISMANAPLSSHSYQ